MTDNRVMAWAVKRPDGEWLHQTALPDTVDVWLMQDFPYHLITTYGASLQPGTWELWALTVDQTKLVRQGGRKKDRRNASWPYTIPTSAILEVGYRVMHKDIKKEGAK